MSEKRKRAALMEHLLTRVEKLRARPTEMELKIAQLNAEVWQAKCEIIYADLLFMTGTRDLYEMHTIAANQRILLDNQELLHEILAALPARDAWMDE